jgi:hypothetical protein
MKRRWAEVQPQARRLRSYKLLRKYTVYSYIVVSSSCRIRLKRVLMHMASCIECSLGETIDCFLLLKKPLLTRISRHEDGSELPKRKQGESLCQFLREAILRHASYKSTTPPSSSPGRRNLTHQQTHCSHPITSYQCPFTFPFAFSFESDLPFSL